MGVNMPKAYFEPKTLIALGGVLHAAKAVMKSRGEDTPANMDWIARRILELASQGMPPTEILIEVVKPLSPAQLGLRASEIELPSAGAGTNSTG